MFSFTSSYTHQSHQVPLAWQHFAWLNWSSTVTTVRTWPPSLRRKDRCQGDYPVLELPPAYQDLADVISKKGAHALQPCMKRSVSNNPC